MPELRIILTDEEYAKILALKGDKTHRELLLDCLGISYETRKLGRPFKSADQLKLEGEEYKARKLEAFKKSQKDARIEKMRKFNEQFKEG